MIIHQRNEQGGWWICVTAVITVNVFPTELTIETQEENSQHQPTWMDARVVHKPHLSGNVNLTLHLRAGQ
jgi:hypothetical protein